MKKFNGYENHLMPFVCEMCNKAMEEEDHDFCDICDDCRDEHLT